jgi:hypothetical protein
LLWNREGRNRAGPRELIVFVLLFAVVCRPAVGAFVNGLGESFTVPATTPLLDNVSTGALTGTTAGASYEFDLLELSGTNVVGPPLFELAGLTGPVGAFQIVPIHILLVANHTYAFALLSSSTASAVLAQVQPGLEGNNIVNCFGNDAACVCGIVLSNYGVGGFSASLAHVSVTEPATAALLGIGVAGLAAWRRRKLN